jgi:S1-C subfamily serine protease
VLAGVVDVYARVPGATSAGTGIVLGAGEVVTNNHVVAGSTAIAATDPATGRTYPAVLLGADARHDIALIRVQGAPDLPVATLGNSDNVQVGDSVEAVGNIGGNGGAPKVTIGQVTGLRQSVLANDEFRHSQRLLHGMIRVDASVQPGDSGGPLLDDRDEVIGMDTAGTAGAGFAIPIDTVLSAVRKLERDSPTQDTPGPVPRELAAGDDDTSDRTLLGIG